MSDETILEKSGCVRCGKPSKNGGKGGRCSSCLDKLSSKRKSPGSKERSWQHADQALRRERGGSGTTTGGHKSGHGERHEIQEKMKNAEKKTGQKLSLDRKDNERGYESTNTRVAPQAMNRGAHHIDAKKLAAWKKKLKKNNISWEDLLVLVKSKLEQNEELLALIKKTQEEK